MFEIYVGSSFDPKKVITSKNVTLREVLDNNEVIVPANAILMHGTKRLGDNDYDRTLEELGVTDGSVITYSEKLNGATN